MVAKAAIGRVAMARIAMARIAMGCVAKMQWRGLRGEDCDGEDYTLRKLFTITAAVGGR